jgi:hypothetical protein
MRFHCAFDLRDWLICVFWHSRTRRLYIHPVFCIRMSIQFPRPNAGSFHDFAEIPGEEFDI